MARQYQIPGGPYINAAQDGREYQLPGQAYFNDETVAAGGSVFIPIVGRGPGMALAGSGGLAA